MIGPRVPWLALGGIGTGIGVWLLGTGVARGLLRVPPCPMKALLGIPCATCGFTRMSMALAQGHWGEAWHWHPVAFTLALLAPWALGWDLRRAQQGRPYPRLPDHLGWRLGLVGFVLATWLLQVARGV